MSADATPVNADALVRDRVRCVGGARGGRARVCARARCVAVARVSFVCVVRVPLSSCRAAAAPRHAVSRPSSTFVVVGRWAACAAAACGGGRRRYVPFLVLARSRCVVGRRSRLSVGACPARVVPLASARAPGREERWTLARCRCRCRWPCRCVAARFCFLRARLWHGRVSRPLPCRARACVRTRAVPARLVSWRAPLLAPRRFLAQQQSFVARNRFTNFCLWSARWRRRFWRFEPDDVARCCVLS